MVTKLYLITFILLSGCKTDSLKSEDKISIPSRDFERLMYNNPGLKVDLGVGLWAWPLPMDYDGDGDIDLIVSCPDTPFNGTYYFENTTGQNSATTIFKAPVRIGEGKKNLQVSYINGKARIHGPGLEYVDFETKTFSNPKKLYENDSLEKLHEKIRFSQWKYVDYENDGDLDLLVGLDDWGDYGWDNAFDNKGNWTNGPLHGYVYLLENIDGTYKNNGKIKANGRAIDVYGAPSPNMDDFDGDGDLDLICGEFLDKLTYYENIGSRDKPEFAQGQFLSNKEGVIKMDLEMIIPTSIDWDKDGDVDLIVGDEDGRVAYIENSGTVIDNMPLFSSPVYLKQEAEYVKFGALATPYAVDWDDDGDEDLICGNSAGYLSFIENLSNGDTPKWAAPVILKANGETIRYQAGNSGSIQGPAESKWGYTTLSVDDWDGDGLNDIMVNSIWGQVEWHKNIGEKGSPELRTAQPIIVDWPKDNVPKPEWNWWAPKDNQLVTQWRTTPYMIDWNKDELMDLVMLDHEGYLTFYERFKEENVLKLKPGQHIFSGVDGSGFDRKNVLKDSSTGPLRLNTEKFGKSGRRKFCFVDWDQDGDLDLIVNSMNAALFENIGEKDGKVLLKWKGNLSDEKLAGHTTSPTIVDWDKNGIPDLLLGAEDGHFYHLINPNN